MKTIVQFKWVNYILCEYISVKLLKAKWFSGINNSPFVLFLHLASKESELLKKHDSIRIDLYYFVC